VDRRRAIRNIARGGRTVATLALVLLVGSPAGGFSFADGRVELHGFFQTTARTLSDGYRSDRFYVSQWVNVLNLESDISIAPDGWGPFDLVSAFARVEVRYECIYTGCGSKTYRRFGDRSSIGPARNWTDGHTTGLTGLEPSPAGREDLHVDTELLSILDTPLIAGLRDFGATNLEATFAPVLGDAFVFKETFGTLSSGNSQLGPWRPETQVSPIAKLATVDNRTNTAVFPSGTMVEFPLPMRPQVPDAPVTLGGPMGLYSPSPRLREGDLGDGWDTLDLNFSQSDLEWNHGAGQDEKELKEAYVEFEMFDSRLWVRAGKQNIVWGKTELFRTTDQFNPQDIALASLSSLEESRLGLWSVRGVWSFYDVGPMEDLRLELAVNYDDFEPTDLGTCGEPYTPWLVCSKAVGAYAHGLTGLGLVGEIRPDDPWDDASGIEVGARIEWRWDRFSFALTDFYGYSDGPYIDSIAFYERNVDPNTGRPRIAGARGPCLTGAEPACLKDGRVEVVGAGTPENALDFHPSDRQLYDLFCSATVGVASDSFGALVGDTCIVDIPNIFPTSTVLSSFLAGNDPLFGLPVDLVVLNLDPFDGVDRMGVGDVMSPKLGTHLTPEQQALLGCGPFYQTSCDADPATGIGGIDLFNSEGSVLLQAFPQIEGNPPVATRYVDGRRIILPGARSPFDNPGDPADDPTLYDPRIDGCVFAPGPTVDPGEPIAICNQSNNGAGAERIGIVDPVTGEFIQFDNELEAVSYNFMLLLVGLNLASQAADPPEPGEEVCDPLDPITCGLQRAAVAITGVQRPELRAAGNGRFGRRDWIWQGGGQAQLRYDRRNVLGFSMDFAEDVTKTNWGMEFTWIDDAITGSSTTESLNQRADFFNLTISMDRPTFVNFLNQNRTLFFNSQWFFGYTKGYNNSFPGNGPNNVLATFTVATGYFQDRLLPSMTFVHDFQSSSGGSIIQVGYRFTENFSTSFGAAIFYGTPQDSPVSTFQLGLGNNGGDFDSQNSYNGLSAISERDELFVSMRYTF
jgi:hypothetical protein